MNATCFKLRLIAVLIFVPAAFATAAIPSTERDALIALHSSTNGSSWDDKTGWLGAAGTECSWYGITCNGAGDAVTGINLFNNGLDGALPAILDQLPSLQILNLSSNNLSGTIPGSLGSITTLQELDLGYGGSLTGGIPPELGNLGALTLLALDHHDLSGSIPTSIFALANLENLGLSGNELTGGIPAAVSGLASARIVDLSSNPLGGTIPPELGNLGGLERLLLTSCELIGGIPPELGDLSNLTYLKLGSNHLSGEIPPELGNLSNVFLLDLSRNALSGRLPPELAGMASLRYLHADANLLSGPIPGELGDLPAIETLNLTDNRLTGAIPAELADAATLSNIFLGRNRLTGPLPEVFGLMADLRSLAIDRNAIVDQVPSLWVNLTTLTDGGSDFRFNGLYTPNTSLSAWLDQKQVGVESWTASQTLPTSDFTILGQNGVAVWGGLQQQGLIDLPGGLDIEVSDGDSRWIGASAGFRTTTTWEVPGLVPGVEYSLRARSWIWPHPENGNTIVGEWTDPITTTLSPEPSIFYVAPDGLPGNDCLSATAPCPSITDALALTSGHERIVVAPGTYPEIISLGTSMEIAGEDPATTVIDGGSSGPVLSISGNTVRVTVRGLTLQNGSGTNGGGVEVVQWSALTMENCRVTGNTAFDGAGFFVESTSSMFLRDSIVSSNDAGGAGGGGRSHGLLLVQGSHITDNTAADGGGLSQAPLTGPGALRVEECEIRGNLAHTGLAGGISFATRYLGVDRSTIVDNTAPLAGAGAGSADVMRISNSTISGNTSLEYSFASGLRLFAGTGELDSCTVTDQHGLGPAPALDFDQPVKLVNTIVAGNDPLNCLGFVVSLGHNLDDADSCGFDLLTDEVNTNPLLGTLADNGGPTWTHALDPASPAVDGGPQWTDLSTDQRGFPRPFDGDGDGTATADIGAFELLINLVFSNGFESGDTSDWSWTTP